MRTTLGLRENSYAPVQQPVMHTLLGGHDSGIFHNFLIAAKWVSHYFWNFRVVLTADWLGNQCVL